MTRKTAPQRRSRVRCPVREWLRYLAVKCLCAVNVTPRLLQLVMLPHAMLRACASLRFWGNILRFRGYVGCPDTRILFLLKYFLRRSTDPVLGMLICEKPDTFLPYVRITGREHVDSVRKQGTGVIVIGNHGGPSLLQTFLFTNVFGVPLGSFSDRGNRWAKERPQLLASECLIQGLPLYKTGEEKKLLKGLLAGEWVNILLDTPFPSARPVNCRVLSCDAALPLFPFRVSLTYGIPLLHVRIRRETLTGITVTIEPIKKFDTPGGGLLQYVEKLEELLRQDPYSNSHVPKWLGTRQERCDDSPLLSR